MEWIHCTNLRGLYCGVKGEDDCIRCRNTFTCLTSEKLKNCPNTKTSLDIKKDKTLAFCIGAKIKKEHETDKSDK
jgi:hypothetical protein